MKGKRKDVCAVCCSGKRKERAGKEAKLRWWDRRGEEEEVAKARRGSKKGSDLEMRLRG